MEYLADLMRELERFGMSPARLVTEMLLAGLLVRLIKGRFPWPRALPWVSVGAGLALAGAAFARSGLGPTWIPTFALEGVVAGAVAAWGNDALKPLVSAAAGRVVGADRGDALARWLLGTSKDAPAPEVSR